MKKSLSVLIVIISIIFCSCTQAPTQTATEPQADSKAISGEHGNTNASSTYYNYKTDCQFGATKPPQKVTKGKDGYYVMSENGYIYFCDPEKGMASPLCNKPNCLHDTGGGAVNGCYARVIESDSNIAYNDGYLYFQDEENDDGVFGYKPTIVRLTPDGSGSKKTVYTGDLPISIWVIHREYLYIASSEFNSRKGSKENATSRLLLYKVSLNKPDERVLLYDSKDYHDFSSFHYLALFDEYVYFNISYEDENENTVDKLYCCNINDGKLSGITMPDKKKYNGLNVFPLGDKLVFDDKKRVYQCDLSGKNVKEIMTVDKGHTIFTDGTYLYEDNFTNYVFADDESLHKQFDYKGESSRILKVYDTNYNLIDTLDVGKTEHSFCPCDDEYFIRENKNYETDKTENFGFWNKSEIGSVNGSQWVENTMEILS